MGAGFEETDPSATADGTDDATDNATELLDAPSILPGYD
jgi:hypothetical protein